MVDVDRIVEGVTDESVSAIHHALRPSRRRLAVLLVVHYTLPQPGLPNPNPSGNDKEDAEHIAVPVRQLARDIVSIEEGIPADHASGPPYRNVYNSLVQTHLPRLDEVGAIRFDDDRKTVKPDCNIFALSVIAAITSPLAQKLFHATVASLYAGGTVIPDPSISD